MKKVIFLAVLIPYCTFGQIVENFESGTIVNWSQSSPDRWKADTAARISGAFSLHHIFDNPVTGTDQAGVPLRNIHPAEGSTRWSFSVRYGYDPSSSNNWSVFLFSDSEPAMMSTDGLNNGFVIGVNLTGSDDTLRLSKIKGNEVTTIVNCRINWQSSVGISQAVKINIERFPDGLWKVDVYRSNGELLSQSSGTDNELFNIGWFGILYRYTSTKDRLLWFDDLNIEGVFYEDIEAPAVTGLKVTGRNTMELTFSEEPLEENIRPENFSLNSPENKSLSIEKINEFNYRIGLAGLFTNKSTNILIIDQICDKRGNCSINIRVPFNPLWAEAGDVVISELMADPLPVVSLPGREYIEILNRTAFQYNLKNWILRSGDQHYTLSEKLIAPHERIILCLKSDTSIFKNYGNVAGLKQFPALTDDGGLLCLSDSLGNLIHGIEYSSDWYRNELKSSGGWSLEMIDPEYPFYYWNNWKASVSRSGGTPGYENSVSANNPDVEFSGIQNVFADDSLNIMINFSEPVLNLAEMIGHISIDGEDLTDIHSTDPLFREFCIKPGIALKRGKQYSIKVTDVNDFSGNSIERSNFIFGLAEECATNELLFNELLFNPFPGDPDYLELFNGSEKILDASRLQISSINNTGDTSQTVTLSEKPLCILPGSYFTITTDRLKILERYSSANPEYLYENQSFPSMTDDEGHLILYNRELDKIDEVSYNKNMHDSLINDPEGVALEKISRFSESEEPSNWYSASEVSGRGTPGALNSTENQVINEDKEPPTLSGCRVTGRNSLEVTFTEEPSGEANNPENYFVNSAENKAFSVLRINEVIYRLEFGEFINKDTNSLLIKQICDKKENCSMEIRVPFSPIWAEAGDVIISEIMSDPLPSVGLPGREYIEILNMTAFQYNLKNWILRSGDQHYSLTEKLIAPHERIILCLKSDTAIFKMYGNVAGLKQFPSLVDDGSLLCLSDSLGNFIHGIEYSSDWYRDELKSAGGWSLEMIDTGYPFYYGNNWKASVSRTGGTPGSENSISGNNPDVEFSGIRNVFAEDSLSIMISFLEPVLNLKELTGNISIEGTNLTDLYSTDPLFREFCIKPGIALQRGKEYSVEITEVTDFAGNMIENSNFIFGLAEQCTTDDLSFNELLFNPLPGDPDYLELYNGSEKILDASRLQVISINSSGDTSQTVTLSERPLCIFPGSYFAITTDRSKIIERYYSANPEYLFETQSVPSMTDDEGHLILYNRELDKIDEVIYNKSMHNTLIKDPEGIALEKISPRNKSEERINWHSASETSGWGTPGASNSILTESLKTSDIVSFSSTRITANSDGFEDILSINLSLTGTGNVVTIHIFDESGNFIGKIASNMLMGAEGSFLWDGTYEDGTPVETGIYVILIKLYDDTGKNRSWKKVCTVIRN